MELTGIHHVTAVSGDGPRNVDFYRRVLGLRPIKKTVNQDMTSTYHLFYADELATPGTDMTFFVWPTVPPHRPGAGDVAATTFVVPDEAAVGWWIQRFDEEGVLHGQIEDWSGRLTLAFHDREGQRLELVAGRRDDVTPWRKGPVPAEVAIHGFSSVDLVVPSLDPSSRLLQETLGFRQTREYTSPDKTRRVAVFETAEGGLGAEVHVEERKEMGQARVGVGGVHHVAFRTPNQEEQRAWRERLVKAGMGVTPVIDRYYFQSIYFREPGGVLYEIATDGPGFTGDEDLEHLGEKLSLPPFLEHLRPQIEAELPPLDLVA